MAFMANVTMTSATAAMGQQQGSHGRRPGKPHAGKTGDDLAAIACFNMRSVASICTSKVRRRKKRKFCLDSEPIRLPSDPSFMRVRFELKAIRTHETASGYRCPVQEIVHAGQRFWKSCREWVRTRIHKKFAWVEYQVRATMVADGNGRLATALCAGSCFAPSGGFNYAFWQRSQMHDKLKEGYDAFREYYPKYV